MIGISGQDDAATMAEFTTEYGLDSFEHVADITGQVWVIFGVTAQPSFIFINDDGEIRRHVGGMTREEIKEELDLLVAS